MDHEPHGNSGPLSIQESDLLTRRPGGVWAGTEERDATRKGIVSAS